MNRQKRRLWRCAVLWMTVWLLLCGTVHAAGGTLTLRYAFDGVAFSIYRVAEPTAAGYALTGPFDDCRVRLPRPEDGASVWKDAAETLAGYAAGKQPTARDVTHGGQVTFAGLEPGLHLAVGDCHTLNGKTYIPVILLAEVTGGGSAGADVKWEWDDDGDEPGGGGSESRISLRVEKRWLGDDPAERPSSVELWLLRDGALWEQVILTEDDHWCRTWNSLEPGHRWQVTEPEVSEGYTVSVSRQRELFAVTNSGEAAGEEPAPLGSLLPQTGQLWWPAILLAALGLLLLLRAFRLRRRK